jgi:glycosyltransferase involved in cell wall biosynthesis
MMGKPTVCVVHTAPDHCNFNRLRWIPGFVRTQFIRAFASMLKRCDAVIALSAKHAGSLREAGIPITHVAPIPVLAGAELEVAYRHHVWARRGPEVIGFVGELSRLKGADVLPALMSALSPRYALCIVGDGPLSRSLACAAKLLSSDASARVTFAGMVAPAEMGAIYRKFDCIMMLSRTESQSRVTLEAMLAGVIVLASPHAGLDDIVLDEVTGLFIDPGRPETVLEKLRYLGQFPSTAARIRACARAFALDLMSRSACDWKELVRTALGQQGLETGI